MTDVALEPAPPARRAGLTTRGQRITGWVSAVLGANAVVLLLNTFCGVLTARVMGPSLKGIFNAVVMWPTVMATLTAVGLPAAFTTLYARARMEDRRELFWVTMLLAAAWGVIGTAACVAVAPPLLRHLGPGIGAWIVAGALIQAPTTAVLVCVALLSVEEVFAWSNWVNVGRMCVLTLCVVALAWSGRLTPYSQLVVTWATSFAAGMVLLLRGLQKAAELRRTARAWLSLRVARQVSGFGFRFHAISMAFVFNAQLDQMIASAWLSARAIGLYAVACSSLSIVGAIGGAFSTVFFPMVAADDREDIVRRTVLAFRRGAIVFTATAVALACAAHVLLVVLYGPRYVEAASAIIVLVPVSVFAGCTGVLYQGCSALRLLRVPTFGELVGAGSGAVLLVLMVPAWGILGAAWAGSISYALNLAVVAWLWTRYQGSEWRSLVPDRDDARAVGMEIGRQLERLKRKLAHNWA